MSSDNQSSPPRRRTGAITVIGKHVIAHGNHVENVRGMDGISITAETMDVGDSSATNTTGVGFQLNGDDIRARGLKTHQTQAGGINVRAFDGGSDAQPSQDSKPRRLVNGWKPEKDK